MARKILIIIIITTTPLSSSSSSSPPLPPPSSHHYQRARYTRYRRNRGSTGYVDGILPPPTTYMLRALLRESLELPRGSRHAQTRTTPYFVRTFLIVLFFSLGANPNFRPSDHRPRRNVELSARGSTGTLGAFPYSLASAYIPLQPRLLARDSLRGLYRVRYMCSPVSSSTDRIRTGFGILGTSASPRGDRDSCHTTVTVRRDDSSTQTCHCPRRLVSENVFQIYTLVFDKYLFRRSSRIDKYRILEPSDPLILRHPVYIREFLLH